MTDKQLSSYAVIIPAYKPDECLLGLAEQVCDRGWRLIVVNDGSGDGFDGIFSRLDSRATVLSHKVNQGKGVAIKTGLTHVQALIEADPTHAPKVVGIMDADGQHLPEDMARVLTAASENMGDGVTLPRLALGVRVIDGKMPLRSRFGNSMTRGVFHLITGTRVSDTQTGLRAFDVSMIPMMLDIDGERYEYEINVLSVVAHKKYGFCEVPIKTIYRDEQNSTSHFRVIRDSIRIYRSLLKYVASSMISFVVDYGLCCLLMFLLASKGPNVALILSNLLARLVSSSVNYLINCYVVFKNKPTLKNAGGYALLCAFNISLSIGLQYLWKLLPLYPQVCKLFAEICMFFFSYLIQKKLIFKRRQRQGGKQ